MTEKGEWQKGWLWDFLNPQWQNAAARFLIAFLSVLCALCGKKVLWRKMADFVAVYGGLWRILSQYMADYGGFCRSMTR